MTVNDLLNQLTDLGMSGYGEAEVIVHLRLREPWWSGRRVAMWLPRWVPWGWFREQQSRMFPTVVSSIWIPLSRGGRPIVELFSHEDDEIGCVTADELLNDLAV